MTLFCLGMLIGFGYTTEDANADEKVLDMLMVGAVTEIIGSVISFIWNA